MKGIFRPTWERAKSFFRRESVPADVPEEPAGSGLVDTPKVVGSRRRLSEREWKRRKARLRMARESRRRNR